MKPPTTFIIANKTETNHNQVAISPSTKVDRRAPIIAIPDIALDPDIKGVCNVGGTLVIISKPTKFKALNFYNVKKCIALKI